MNIFVAGGSGFIGQNIISILKKNKKFHIYGSFNSNNCKNLIKSQNITYVKVNFLKKNIDLKKFDFVIISIGYIFSFKNQIKKKFNVKKKIKDNIKIVTNILSKCDIKKNKIILISSAKGYPEKDFELKENDYYKNNIIKSFSKVSQMYRAIEKKIINSKIRYFIFRPGEVYGNYDWKNNSTISGYFYSVYVKKQKIKIDPSFFSIKSYSHATELAEIISKTFYKKSYNKIFNLPCDHLSQIEILRFLQIFLKNKKFLLFKKYKNKTFFNQRIISDQKVKKEFRFNQENVKEKIYKIFRKNLIYYKSKKKL